MQLGMIGLGRMGANMVRRLIRKGHNCVVFDRSPQTVAAQSRAALRCSRLGPWPRGATISKGNVSCRPA